MLLLTKGVAAQTFIVTLNETKTIASPYYVFKIYSVGTSDEILILYNYSSDMSAYPERYNEFLVDETLFADMPAGQYKYEVREAHSSHYGDYSALNIIETGQLDLVAATPINRKGYEPESGQKRGYAG